MNGITVNGQQHFYCAYILRHNVSISCLRLFSIERFSARAVFHFIFQTYNNNLSLSLLTRHLTSMCYSYSSTAMPLIFMNSTSKFDSKTFFFISYEQKTVMDSNCFVNRVKWKCEKCGISNFCGFSEPYI